ncbi:MAG: hypothetical protein ACOX6D_06695 [Thermoguttaceae bacterium]|jgi:hypothetical protein
MDRSRRQFLKLSGALPLLGVTGPCAGISRTLSAGEAVDMPEENQPIFVGDDRQLFMDDYLLGSSENVRIKVHEPIRCPEVLLWNKPWEGNGSVYGSVLYDPTAKRYLMYYSGSCGDNGSGAPLHSSCFCLMTSSDGIHWERPVTGVEFEGNTETNILFLQNEDFAPFIDSNPNAKPEERFKATSGPKDGGILAYASPDGITWHILNNGHPVYTDGAFDSENVAFWSEVENRYVLYYRRPRRDARDVGRAHSKDFIHWTNDGFIEFPVEGEGPHVLGQFYTNQIQPYYRAPKYIIGFPARYVDRGPGVSNSLLPEQEERRQRAAVLPRSATALTDSVYIVSRDGRNFRQSPDVFLKPGLKTKDNWGYGDNYIARGLLETESTLGDEPRELSLYASESRWTGNDAQWRRYKLRIDGFASLAAESKRGYVETKPIIFTGTELAINASTSACGYIKVEFRTPDGKPFEGFSSEDCDIIYGDSVERYVTWNNDRHVSPMEKRPVVLRFSMKEADVYSFRFQYGDSTTKSDHREYS